MKRQKYIAVVKVIETRNKKLESNNVTRLIKENFVGKRYTGALANVTSVIKSSDTSKQILVEYDIPGRIRITSTKRRWIDFFGDKQKMEPTRRSGLLARQSWKNPKVLTNRTTEAPKPRNLSNILMFEDY